MEGDFGKWFIFCEVVRWRGAEVVRENGFVIIPYQREFVAHQSDPAGKTKRSLLTPSFHLFFREIGTVMSRYGRCMHGKSCARDKNILAGM